MTRRFVWRIFSGALICIIGIALFILLSERQQQASSAHLDPLTVTLLKVGKADAIVLREGAHTIVIDAGEEDDGQEVVEFLTDQGVTRIDALIITHFDKDHVAGRIPWWKR